MKIDKNTKICFYTMSFAGGFGDKIFCLKLYSIFEKWYGIKPYLLSPTPEAFIANGISKSRVLHLKIPKSKADDAHKYIEESESIPIVTMNDTEWKKEFDIIFVTPVTMDGWENNLNHFKSIFPYITSDILYRFSAYDHGGMTYEIPLGLSENRYGILISPPQKPTKRIIKNPYIMTHISNINWTEAEGDYKSCLSNFLKLMVKKYHKTYPVLDIVISKSIIGDFSKNDIERFNKLKDYLKKYYGKVKVIKSENDTLLTKGLNIRSDLPVLSHEKFTGMFQHCLPDILGTGNQTISDVVSCCKHFNIFYQQLPWEISFAKNLGRILKKEYLTARRSACGQYGNKSMLYMETDLSVIKENYNFAIKGKPLVDKIMLQFKTKNIKKSSSIKEKMSKKIKKRILSLNKSRRSRKTGTNTKKRKSHKSLKIH
jgi:hypothetical protein